LPAVAAGRPFIDDRPSRTAAPVAPAHEAELLELLPAHLHAFDAESHAWIRRAADGVNRAIPHELVPALHTARVAVPEEVALLPCAVPFRRAQRTTRPEFLRRDLDRIALIRQQRLSLRHRETDGSPLPSRGQQQLRDQVMEPGTGSSFSD